MNNETKKLYNKSNIAAWLFDDKNEISLTKRNHFVVVGRVNGKRVYFLEIRDFVFHNIIQSTTFNSVSALRAAL